MPFGIIEIFYGLPWASSDREAYARFLKEIGFQFYIYAPKADARLRKNWQQDWIAKDMAEFKAMRECFASRGLKFGMALSPQGLHKNKIDLEARRRLLEKISQLSDIGVEILGIFFDDMQSAPDMAERQLEIMSTVQSSTRMKLLFCPSYYSFDSLLDMLFGDRPEGYLEAIGNGLPSDVEVVWTGEQIISDKISLEHLENVRDLIRRKPFICDNFFANDGPLNCNFLKPVPISGRERNIFEAASGWAFNPMNQPYLSQLVLYSFAGYFNRGLIPQMAFENAIQQLCAPPTAEIILQRYKQFAEEGLDHISDSEKTALRETFLITNGPIERELMRWLDGQYTVSFEAVMDQSGFEPS